MTYSPVNLIFDLGCVLRKLNTVDGANRLLSKLTNAGSYGLIGERYELQVAAYLDRDNSITHIKLPTENLVNTSGGKTEFDVIADGVYYQAKVSRAAFFGRPIEDPVTGRTRRVKTQTL